MKCTECPYYWQDKDEQYPSCHAAPNWPALCEYDDYEMEES